MQLSSLVCSPAKWLLDNMEGNLKDIVHSKTYGSNPWPMQFQKVFYTDIYIYITMARVIGKRWKLTHFWVQFHIVKVVVSYNYLLKLVLIDGRQIKGNDYLLQFAIHCHKNNSKKALGSIVSMNLS